MSTPSPEHGPGEAEQPGRSAESTSGGSRNGQHRVPPREPQPAADAPVARVADVADHSRVRRAPRYGRFGIVGFLVGALLSLVLALVPDGLEISRGALFLVLLLALGTAGVFAGLTWALVADRRSLRRTRQG
ncbi:hypothetical protein FHE66_00185 [Georgenia sp. 311]|uniref:DUF308 domain-containing protein n=1 Tax=Georgenia wutianyii TaxID=2585135 RepID=A0ABX5VQT6_9MICO|nr:MULTISPECIES: hypothetical protein [Georgenia]QDB80413.1 hypothetical protein FE251_14280 [Georgenia wutianyii]TNC21374.1 hypothetical protein FHE66_00185 [Georgenia sp. 311]